MELVIKSTNIKDTKKVAKRVSKMLRGGEVICLTGDLGAGKTTFTQMLLKYLGVKDIVSSPTFTIAKQYATKRGSIYHLDLYRVESGEELIEIGLAEMLDSGYLVVIEWPEVAKEYLQKDVINISISFDEEMCRVFTIEGEIL